MAIIDHPLDPRPVRREDTGSHKPARWLKGPPLRPAEYVERDHFLTSDRMQGVVGIGRPVMTRVCLTTSQRDEARSADGLGEGVRRAEADSFREIGEDEPGLPARIEMGRAPVEEPPQETTVGVE